MSAPEANPAATLKRHCRAAILKSKGKSDSAYELFNLWLIRENNAVLERELCSSYRSIAIKALMAEQFNELRAEGRLLRETGVKTRISTTNYDMRRGHKSWAAEHIGQIKVRIEEERCAYEDRILDAFRVNGEPIGDCTPEMVLSAAERNESDARFMRLVSSGVPPQAKIRDYVSSEEAKERWKMATEKPAQAMTMVQWMSNDWMGTPECPTSKWLFSGIKSDAQLEIAMKRVDELMGAKPHTMAGVELDALARIIKEYEDKQ